MEKLIVLSSSVLLIGGISWFFFGKKENEKTQPTEEKEGNTEKFELNISGMHCAGCAAGIEGTIKALEGVKVAQVNFATSKGIFEINPAKITKEQIIQRIKELGYDATLDIESLEKKS